ncbi:MAG: DUF4360 domain-containing protein [Pseudobdellovibrio sp.]
MKSKINLLAVILSFSFSAYAQMELGLPTYGGNGCPQGTASVSLTEDHKVMSVLFDKFIAEAGSTTGRRVDRASCNLRIPIQVMPGYSVAVIKSDYRGFTAVPGNGASATFNSEYFFAGAGRGPKATKKFVGPMSDSFIISNDIVTGVWSPCGGDVIFAVNASATAMSNSAMQQTMMIVDSVDMSSQDLGLIYSFSWRQCH